MNSRVILVFNLWRISQAEKRRAVIAAALRAKRKATAAAAAGQSMLF
jgi:hypothetical protein